jgi:hypothetical protein
LAGLYAGTIYLLQSRVGVCDPDAQAAVPLNSTPRRLPGRLPDELGHLAVIVLMPTAAFKDVDSQWLLVGL